MYRDFTEARKKLRNRKENYPSKTLLVTDRDRQTDRRTGRQTDRQAGRQTNKQTDRQTDRHTDRISMNNKSATVEPS